MMLAAAGSRGGNEMRAGADNIAGEEESFDTIISTDSSDGGSLSHSRRRRTTKTATRGRPKSALGKFSYISPTRSTWKPNSNNDTSSSDRGEDENEDAPVLAGDEHRDRSSIFGGSSSPSTSSNNTESKTTKKRESGIMNGRKKHNKILVHKMHKKKQQLQYQQEQEQQHVGELATKPKGIDEAVARTLVNEYDLPRHRAANAAR